MLKKLLILCALAACWAAPAAAGIMPGSFSLSPMVGGHVFEGNQSLENSLLGGIGLGYNLTEHAALEAVFTQTNADAEDASTSDSKVRTYRLDALYHFTPENTLVPYLAIGFGGIDTNPDDSDIERHFMANYGVGIKYFLDQWVALRADVRHLLNFPEPDNNLLYSAGLYIQFGTPAAAPAAVMIPTAPEPLDSDGDGVADERDQCPDTTTGTPVDVNGCPLDTDGDGVVDSLDSCPDTPQGTEVDSSGCGLDSDGDGVADLHDSCPETPKGAPVDDSGCPLDSDADGVFDYLDQCPATPKAVSIDALGCPTTLKLQINFGLDSNQIAEQYLSEIAKAAQCINEYPGNLVYIDGHTDNQGPTDYNQTLSERRAAAVVKALIEKFAIPAERLNARGFGESQPVADNAIKAGRLANRRVEVACGAK